MLGYGIREIFMSSHIGPTIFRPSSSLTADAVKLAAKVGLFVSLHNLNGFYYKIKGGLPAW